eukprot:13371622-Alexandrium_andersonii.AAC.1
MGAVGPPERTRRKALEKARKLREAATNRLQRCFFVRCCMSAAGRNPRHTRSNAAARCEPERLDDRRRPSCSPFEAGSEPHCLTIRWQ